MPSIITRHYPKGTREFYLDVKIGPSFGRRRKQKRYHGLIDTGATNSGVSERVVSELGLKPSDVVRLITANGETFCSCYDIELTLSNNFSRRLFVTGVDIKDIDIIIGMDLIEEGDFAISTNLETEDRCISLRIPSQGEIDFHRTCHI